MNGVLKFLNSSPEIKVTPGKKCFPQRSVGVSKQAPQEFQLKNTLVNPEGYQWVQPKANPLISNSRYISVIGDGHIKNNFQDDHHQRVSQEKSPFGRKKGLLSEYMDNHAWQNQVNRLMGLQRSDEGRKLKNIQLSKMKLASKQKSQKRSRSTFYKSFQRSSCFQTLPVGILQKNKIRRKRNQLYQNQMNVVNQTQKFKRQTDSSSIDQFISNRGGTISFLHLHCPEDNGAIRPRSQNYRTMDSWVCNSARTGFAVGKEGKRGGSMEKQKILGSTMDVFEDNELQQFQGRFLKNGIFKASRNGFESRSKCVK